MSSIIPIARNAFKRSSVRIARPASAAPRYYSSTMHDNDPEVRLDFGWSTVNVFDWSPPRGDLDTRDGEETEFVEAAA